MKLYYEEVKQDTKLIINFNSCGLNIWSQVVAIHTACWNIKKLSVLRSLVGYVCKSYDFHNKQRLFSARELTGWFL
jgi:hypothetical protein